MYLNYYCYHKSCAESGKTMRDCLDWKKKCNRYSRKHLWLYTLSGYCAWRAQYSWKYITESNLNKYIWEKQVFQKAFPPSADLVERAFPPRLSTQSFFLPQLHQYEYISRRICSEEKNQHVFAWLSVGFECMVKKRQDRGDSNISKASHPSGATFTQMYL